MTAATQSFDALAAQQNQLLDQIFTARTSAPSRGLSAYRANAQASAQRALAAAYPVLAQCVGEDNFTYLARDFWHRHPPQRGDLAQWGDALAAFVEAAPQLQHLPYLADVVHIEWALHVCASAPDTDQNLASFTLLNEHAPEHVRLQFAPGACVLPSDYPAAAICLSHGGEARLEDAVALLHAGTAQTALVWRRGFAPRLQVLAQVDIGFVNASLHGASLAVALDAAHADFNFSAWLTASVQGGLVLGVLVTI
jgi:Putative DNA-binding domain